MDVDYEEESEDGVNRIVHFNKTPVMSTYLVAFAVGEYDHVEATTTDGVRVRVYTPRGKSAQVIIMKQLNPIDHKFELWQQILCAKGKKDLET